MVTDAPTRHDRFMFEPDRSVAEWLLSGPADDRDEPSAPATPPAQATEASEVPAVESLAAVAATIQRDLRKAEAQLREAWQDAAPLAPRLAARLNIAARLIHNAASALSSDTLI